MYSHTPLLVIGQCASVLDRYAKIRQAAWPMRLVWKSAKAIGGVAHYDPWPSLKYRQHRQNLVGSNIGARLVRMLAFANGRVVMWNDTNIKTLGAMRNLFTPENAATLYHFSHARQSSLPIRLFLLWKSGVYRQNAVENVGLFVGALFGRL